MDPRLDLEDLLARELARRHIRMLPATKAGHVLLERGGARMLVHMEAVLRDAERRGDPEALRRFLDGLFAAPLEVPGWIVAQAGVRLSLESADHDFRDALVSPLTRATRAVLAWTDPKERAITWLSAGTLERWGFVDVEDVHAVARENMARLLEETPVEVHPFRGHPVAIFQTDSIFKASLLLAPNLKEVLAPRIGWPVLAVAPCRNFLLAFAEKERDLLPNLGDVVLHEFEESRHPIAPEVLRVSDAGFSGIGAYQPAP